MLGVDCYQVRGGVGSGKDGSVCEVKNGDFVPLPPGLAPLGGKVSCRALVICSTAPAR